MKDRIHPLSALTHPAWLSALIILFLNDHFLKFSEIAGPLTWKLSDFAGLLVAPTLLAALLGSKSKRGWWLGAIVTGAVFSLINLSANAAIFWDSAVSTIIPFHTTTDPTDLIALTMIPLGWIILGPSMQTAPKRLSVSPRYAIVAISTVMCMATSCGEPCDTDSDCPSGDVCDGELCGPRTLPCQTNSDCPSDLECSTRLEICLIDASSVDMPNMSMLERPDGRDEQHRRIVEPSVIDRTGLKTEPLDQERLFKIDPAPTLSSVLSSQNRPEP